VVLSNGQAITANHTSYPDLFRALKGGGNNLGLVKKVELRAFEQGPLWGGLIGHVSTDISQQNTALVTLTSNLMQDPHAQVVTIWNYNAKSKATVVASGLQHTLGPENPAIFRDFLDIPQTFSTLRTTDIYDLMMETAPPPGKRALFLTLTFGNDVRVIERLRTLQDESIEAATARAESTDWDFITFLQPFPSVLGDASKRKENILGLDRVEGDHIRKSPT
jgi:hypothetical protein